MKMMDAAAVDQDDVVVGDSVAPDLQAKGRRSERQAALSLVPRECKVSVDFLDCSSCCNLEAYIVHTYNQ